jgi:hypothetical protein
MYFSEAGAITLAEHFPGVCEALAPALHKGKTDSLPLGHPGILFIPAIRKELTPHHSAFIAYSRAAIAQVCQFFVLTSKIPRGNVESSARGWGDGGTAFGKQCCRVSASCSHYFPSSGVC